MHSVPTLPKTLLTPLPGGSALAYFSRCLLSTYYALGDSCWGHSVDGSLEVQEPAVSDGVIENKQQADTMSGAVPEPESARTALDQVL